ncbi:hypothetical protein SESBI_39400 [Sesbania bispinosa]|nr:hypothetical protein SESBI_39400 [Sesbania bispinosa]
MNRDGNKWRTRRDLSDGSGGSIWITISVQGELYGGLRVRLDRELNGGGGSVNGDSFRDFERWWE